MARAIKEIMTRDVETVTPDTSIQEAARKMRSEDVGSIPVVERGKLKGILTDRDIAISAVAEGLPLTTPVVDIMTGAPQSIEPDTTIHRAAQLMQIHQIRRLPVCDENGTLVGIVSLGDLATDSESPDLKAETLEEVSTPTHA